MDSFAVGSSSRRVGWKVEQWPEKDQQAWSQALDAGDFLSDGGGAANWRPASRRAAIGAYGLLLAYLDRHGLLDPAAGPAARPLPEIMRRYVASLQDERSSVTVANYVAILTMMFKALAPAEDWRWLSTLQAGLQRRAVPTRDKRSRLVPASDLLQLGCDLMVQADAHASQEMAAGGLTLTTSLQFRDGLMLAMLTLHPVRQKNFLEIEIGRHLVPVGDGYAIRFKPEETKNWRAIDGLIHPVLVPQLRRYLFVYRPFLLGLRQTRGSGIRSGGEPGARLWLNQYGRPLGATGQTAALATHTTARFGQPLTSHLFRTIAATSTANEDPEHVRIAAQVLGHQSFGTTERYYILARSRLAFRAYHDEVLSIRKSAKVPSSRRRPSLEPAQ